VTDTSPGVTTHCHTHVTDTSHSAPGSPVTHTHTHVTDTSAGVTTHCHTHVTDTSHSAPGSPVTTHTRSDEPVCPLHHQGHTHATTVLWPFVLDYPNEPVPEETLTHPPS